MATGASDDALKNIDPTAEDENSELPRSSGIIKSASEVEELIFEEIRKLLSNKKRADTTNICQSLARKHGVEKPTTELHLRYLMSTGRLDKNKSRGELFKIVYKDQEDTLNNTEEYNFQKDRNEAEDIVETSKFYRPTPSSCEIPKPEVTLNSESLLRTIGDLAHSLQRTNDLLQMERKLSIDVMKENITLKLRLKDLEIKNTQLRADVRSTSFNSISSTPGKSETKENKKPECINLDETIRSSYAETTSNTNKKATISKEGKNVKANRETKVNKIGTKRKATANEENEMVEHNGKSNKNNNGKRGESSNKTKQQQENRRMLKITVIGDSQERYLDGTKLSNQHHEVQVIADRGARIARMKNQKKMQPDSDIIIVHAGTNNLKTTSPEALSEEVIETLDYIKNGNRHAQVVFSSIFKRKDELHLNAKVIQTNKILKDKLLLKGYDFIDNDNILFNNLALDGLHINQGGLRKFAGNISKYIKFCQ